jgi:hypothetical protein
MGSSHIPSSARSPKAAHDQDMQWRKDPNSKADQQVNNIPSIHIFLPAIPTNASEMQGYRKIKGT